MIVHMKMYSAASDPESPSNKAKRFPLGKVWPDLAGKKRVCRRSVNGAMFETVEGAAVVCYGISQAYKESTNCRLEAQYAFQQQVDMVPLMLEDGYRAKGWLGMLLGVRLVSQPPTFHVFSWLHVCVFACVIGIAYCIHDWIRQWYGFYGSVLESEAAFEGKVDELCRELGERGKVK